MWVLRHLPLLVQPSNAAILLSGVLACAVLPSSAIVQQRCTVAYVTWVVPFSFRAVPADNDIRAYITLLYQPGKILTLGLYVG